MESDWDSAEVVRAATEIGRIARTWDDSTVAHKVLLALCDLAAKNPDRLDPDASPDQWGFVATDIGAALRDLGVKFQSAPNWADDPETAKSRMGDHWPKLEKLWDRQKGPIAAALHSVSIDLELQLVRQEGGGAGKYTKYGFRLAAPPIAEAPLPAIDLLKVPQVTYCERDISGNRLVRGISKHGIYLGGWGGRFYLGFWAAVAVLATLWIWLSLMAIDASPTAAGILKLITANIVILGLGYLSIRWQIRLINDRVTRAPEFLQPWARQGDYLLEVRKAAGAKRNTIYTIYLVRYVANCPICGAEGHETIRIESGRREFFGRLVGRCARAPNAHVFSFDHISRTGRFLR